MEYADLNAFEIVEMLAELAKRDSEELKVSSPQITPDGEHNCFTIEVGTRKFVVTVERVK